MRKVLLAVALVGCDDPTFDVPDVCVVEVSLTDEVPLVVGVATTLAATPLSEAWDTRVRIAGVDVTVTDVTRSECLSCDACRSDNDCQACGACEACADLCGACEETLTLLVPDTIPPGPHDLVLYNRHGVSDPTRVQVLAAP